jgi:hypothetical protein
MDSLRPVGERSGGCVCHRYPPRFGPYVVARCGRVVRSDDLPLPPISRHEDPRCTVGSARPGRSRSSIPAVRGIRRRFPIEGFRRWTAARRTRTSADAGRGSDVRDRLERSSEHRPVGPRHPAIGVARFCPSEPRPDRRRWCRVPGLATDSNRSWGFTGPANKSAVWRSGAGITADGQILWVGGPGLSIEALADTLVRAGAIRGMQLEINQEWVQFNTYSTNAAGTTTGKQLLSGMQHTGDRWLAEDTRDFIAVFAPMP